MGKKIKLGTIKVTRKVTVTQKINQRRQIDVQPIYETITPRINTQPIVSNIEQATRKKTTELKKTTRPSRLPTGVYSPQVETLYEEINKRSKPKEAEECAMYDVFISHASEDKEPFVTPLVEELSWDKKSRGTRVGQTLRETPKTA